MRKTMAIFLVFPLGACSSKLVSTGDPMSSAPGAGGQASGSPAAPSGTPGKNATGFVLPPDAGVVPLPPPAKETDEPVVVGKGGKAFDVTNPPNGPVSSGVGLDPSGAIIVDYTNHSGQNLIWIPHTETAMVSKIDTTTRVELARYRVGAPDPSRTSVAPNGNAYIASRQGAGVTKISALGKNCPDTNKDGVITTSSGPNDVLPWGQDDCVLWFVDLNPLQPEEDDPYMRGIAVQVQAGKLETKPAPGGGAPVVTWIPPKEYVWVGGTNPVKLYKLDGETGQALINMKSPLPVYGLAMDGRDRMEMGGPYLWIAGGHGAHNIGHIDTSRCVDNASCQAQPVCQVACGATNCKSTCDNAIQAHYLLEPANTYGITVDCKQRIWLGSRSRLPISDVKRYDPFAPQDKRLSLVPNTPITHGIAADAEGFVWGAYADKETVYKIHAETLKVVNLKVPTKGLGVDRKGLIWSIPNSSRNQVHVIEPTKDLSGGDKINLAVLTITGEPYVYSDMTGQQLILASNEPGYYRQVFEPCTTANDKTVWKTLEWEAELPKGTLVIVSFRVSNTRGGLAAANWMTTSLAIDNATGSKDIESLFKDLGKSPYLEMEAKLFAANGGTVGDSCRPTTTSGASPKVKKLGVAKVCVPQHDPVTIQ